MAAAEAMQAELEKVPSESVKQQGFSWRSGDIWQPLSERRVRERGSRSPILKDKGDMLRGFTTETRVPATPTSVFLARTTLSNPTQGHKVASHNEGISSTGRPMPERVVAPRGPDKDPIPDQVIENIVGSFLTGMASKL